MAEEEVKVDPMSLLLQMGGLADDKKEAPVPEALKTPSPKAPMGLAVVSAMMETTPPAKIDYAVLAGRKKKKKGDDKEGGPPMKRKEAT